MTAAQTEVTLARVDGRIAMVLRPAEGEPVAVAMTPREAHHLAGRIRKAANDLASHLSRAQCP